MRRALVLCTTAASLAACTVHPRGEREERAHARAEGAAYERAFACRPLPVLVPDAGPERLAEYAIAANADLEAAYWEWRAALERVPQAGTPDTNLALFGSHSFGGEEAAWDRTTLGVQTDPMANLPPPSRLSAAARAALEEARAAGWRFEQAKWDLRRRVHEAWLDLALVAERIRIADLDVAVVEPIVESTSARVETDRATQQNLLAARTSLDLAKNERARLEAKVPPLRAALNALLSRPPDAPVDLPAALPEPRPFSTTDGEVLAIASGRSPELAAMAAEVQAGRGAVDVARTRGLPEVALSGSITGSVMQTLGGMVTLPFLQGEAIRAAVAEARAALRAREERRRQAGNDLAAEVLLDLYGLRDAERQAELFGTVLVPRAEQGVELGRTGYSTGKTTYLELRDAERTLLETRSMRAELRVERERRLVALEASLGTRLAP